MSRHNSFGFLLDAILGLLGLFGMGELYLGRKRRGELFLAYTIVLYTITTLSVAWPKPTAFYSGYLPVAWGIGYFLLLVDIVRLTWPRPASRILMVTEQRP